MKKTVSVISVLLMFIILLSSCVGSPDSSGDISGFSNNASVVGRAVPSLTVDGDSDFTILQFSDTHLINGSTKKM